MRIRSFMLAAALVAPMSLQADVRQKAGLWENTIKVNLGGGMPAIPPEAMAQMEQMGLELQGQFAEWAAAVLAEHGG